MPIRRWIMTACLASLVGLPSPTHALQFYTPREPGAAGTIGGTVAFHGEVPTADKLEVTADPEVCAAEPRFASDLLVAEGNDGLQNVAVWLSDIQEGKDWEARAEPRTLDQRGCSFVPHVLVVPAGEQFFTGNGDGILHNIHTRGESNRPINRAQPGFVETLPMRLRYPGLNARWDQENGYLALLGSVQFFNDRLARAQMAEPSARIDTGEIQIYVFPWLVPGFRVERVTIDRFPQGFPTSFERYSLNVLALLGSNVMLMVGPTWSSESAPDLLLFENFARVSVHLAF